MDIKDNWQMIQQFCRIAMKSSRHLSFASINSDGTPHITPIGSLILRNNCTGYYFEEYTKKMPANFAENPNVSILAVNSGFLFWIKSIFSGKFDCSPGIRLSGKVGERRMATENEISEWHDRMKRARKTKGYNLIWKNLKYVRDIEFDSFELITAGAMTQHIR